MVEAIETVKITKAAILEETNIETAGIEIQTEELKVKVIIMSSEVAVLEEKDMKTAKAADTISTGKSQSLRRGSLAAH